jgi:hypothetical protein
MKYESMMGFLYTKKVKVSMLKTLIEDCAIILLAGQDNQPDPRTFRPSSPRSGDVVLQKVLYFPT